MYKKILKRMIDLLFSILALPVLIILIVFLSPFIYFQDKGPIFYIAPRIGKEGKIYEMYKFRTMKVNAPDIRNLDGSTYNAIDDIRLTTIGVFLRKTSLDEVPQILNILKGDMSIIGPRPDLPGQEKLYERNEFRKLSIRPGITGFNQAYFRNAIPWKDRIKNDIYYVDNYSFWLDVKIFIKTIFIVFKSENVFVVKRNENESVDNNKEGSV